MDFSNDGTSLYYTTNIDAATRALQASKEAVRSTWDARVKNEMGAFGGLFQPAPGRDPIVRPGVRKCYNIEVNGQLKERVVLNTLNAVDISLYDFEVRNLENITNSTSDDFAVMFEDGVEIIPPA